MDTWKTKLFGDNRMNLYGWIVAGLFIFAASAWCALKAWTIGAVHSPTTLLLAAIYVTLLGHFGIALQNYCARVAKFLETEDARGTDSAGSASDSTER
jgi:hypothetical protein